MFHIILKIDASLNWFHNWSVYGHFSKETRCPEDFRNVAFVSKYPWNMFQYILYLFCNILEIDMSQARLRNWSIFSQSRRNLLECDQRFLNQQSARFSKLWKLIWCLNWCSNLEQQIILNKSFMRCHKVSRKIWKICKICKRKLSYDGFLNLS